MGMEPGLFATLNAMTESFSAESPEGFKPIDISIEPPDAIHNNFKLSFDADRPEICAAYNAAISRVADANKLRPFHQTGREHSPGYHGWELWSDSSEESLGVLLPEIQLEAQKAFEKNEQNGMNMHYREKYGSG